MARQSFAVVVLNSEHGPLAGMRIVEIAGIGPAPCCGMMLADMGAEVILVERNADNPNSAGAADPARLGKAAIFKRGKRSISLDLKKKRAVEIVLKLIEKSDALIEGFRPGVLERLGLGPDVCLARNPALVYGRMTGWGQQGPLAKAAGHDINYIALNGALYYSGHQSEAPIAPPTLIGDMGGGAMILTAGVLAGIIHARQSGQGQVIDAAISDGAALLNTLLMSFHQKGLWSDERGSNMLDGAAPWYNSYECSDGNYITVGALEEKFYQLLLKRCGLDNDPDFADQFNKESWVRGKEKMKALFLTKTRDEWCVLMEGSDICFAPVLNFKEAADHPHNRQRQTFIEINSVLQPGPAPRFSATPSKPGLPPVEPGEDTSSILYAIGYNQSDICSLKSAGVINQR